MQVDVLVSTDATAKGIDVPLDIYIYMYICIDIYIDIYIYIMYIRYMWIYI